MNFFVQICPHVPTSNHPQPLLTQGNTRKPTERFQSQNLEVKSSTTSANRQSDRSSSRSWTLTQNRRYAQFLVKHKDLFSLSPEQKKKIKLNVLISRYIKTRTAIQCHSHHQSMMNKIGSIHQIILNYHTPSKLHQFYKGSIASQQSIQENTNPNSSSPLELKQPTQIKLQKKLFESQLPELNSYFYEAQLFSMEHEEWPANHDWLSQ